MNSSERDKVLKMYLGFVLIRYGRMADMKIIVMKEVNTDPGNARHSSLHRVMWEWIGMGQETRGRGRAGPSAFIGVFSGRNGRGNVGMLSKLRIE